MTKDRKTALSSLGRIATLQTHARGAKPRERHQIANRYARLENQRARLEREIGMWEHCRQMAASKLAKVRGEIDLIDRYWLKFRQKRPPPVAGADSAAAAQRRTFAAPPRSYQDFQLDF